MEPTDDPQLSKLLSEWKVENAPPSLEARVLGASQPWWRFLFAGSMRIPVPIALAAMAALFWMGAALVRQRSSPTAQPGPINLVDFRPVEEPAFRIVVNRHEAH